jgi:hypothetical protein
MQWTRRHTYGMVGVLWCSTLASAACARRLPPQEVATRLEERARTRAAAIPLAVLESWECGEGERDWDYICHVRLESSAMTRGRGVEPWVQKVGLKIWGSFDGAPSLQLSRLPDDGPTLSEAELLVYRQEQAARDDAVAANNAWHR